ncbi:MAG: LEA type 2 family protein [Tidjanibacter sp.]|nr:LEA type 2 family protein [Tidjanibacter sp.]MBQ8272902.1 LEA type 2 family protein [Tidjanibacter sp.]
MRRVLRYTTMVLAVAITSLLAGCNFISLNSFVLKEAKILSFDLSKGAVVEMTIENKSLFKVTVLGGELAADLKGDPIGEVFMKHPVVLPRKSTTTVRLDVGLRFASPLAALKALGVLTSSPESLMISGYGEGKIWFFKKRYERRDVPISKFISIFGEPKEYLNN